MEKSIHVTHNPSHPQKYISHKTLIKVTTIKMADKTQFAVNSYKDAKRVHNALSQLSII